MSEHIVVPSIGSGDVICADWSYIRRFEHFVFHGTRVSFKALTDYLEGGESLGEFLEQYASVTREAAIAALEEARDSLMTNLG
jgi:uncharacterized protein (DUF433 family)